MHMSEETKGRLHISRKQKRQTNLENMVCPKVVHGHTDSDSRSHQETVSLGLKKQPQIKIHDIVKEDKSK